MTIRISQLSNVSVIQGNVLLPLVSNATGTLSTVKGTVDDLKTFIVADTEANIAVANVGMVGYVDAVTTAWTANAVAQETKINSLNANAISQQSYIASLEAQIDAIDISLTNANVADLTTSTTLANTIQSAQIDSIVSDISDITDGTATFGNLVPSANVTYNLGSLTAQWNDLYLSGSTIYLGGAEISSDGSTITTSLPIESSAVTTTGNVSADYGLFANVVATHTETTQITGNLTIQGTEPQPLSLIINPSDSAFPGIRFPDLAKVFEGNLGLYPQLSLKAPTNGRSSISAANSGNVSLTNSIEIGQEANITVYNGSENSVSWLFANDGNMTFPDSTAQSTAYTASFTNATPSSASDTGTKGDIQYDANYVYICVDTDTWIRCARTAW